MSESMHVCVNDMPSTWKLECYTVLKNNGLPLVTAFSEALNTSYDSRSRVNTFLGNKGSLISGGQSQRLALARNLYNQPEILVLDEAFSALDDITSNKIISELIKIKDLTIVLVSHNYDLLKNFQKVFEISNNTLNVKNI